MAVNEAARFPLRSRREGRGRGEVRAYFSFADQQGLRAGSARHIERQAKPHRQRRLMEFSRIADREAAILICAVTLPLFMTEPAKIEQSSLITIRSRCAGRGTGHPGAEPAQVEGEVQSPARGRGGGQVALDLPASGGSLSHHAEAPVSRGSASSRWSPVAEPAGQREHGGFAGYAGRVR